MKYKPKKVYQFVSIVNFKESGAQKSDEKSIIGSSWHTITFFYKRKWPNLFGETEKWELLMDAPKIMSRSSCISAHTRSGSSPWLLAMSITSLGNSGPKSMVCDTLTGIFHLLIEMQKTKSIKILPLFFYSGSRPVLKQLYIQIRSFFTTTNRQTTKARCFE